MKIMRVFPRKTNATPIDNLTAIGTPKEYISNSLYPLPDYEEVHISTLFIYDIPKAQGLKIAWQKTCDKVKLGGPAMGIIGARNSRPVCILNIHM